MKRKNLLQQQVIFDHEFSLKSKTFFWLFYIDRKAELSPCIWINLASYIQDWLFQNFGTVFLSKKPFHTLIILLLPRSYTRLFKMLFGVVTLQTKQTFHIMQSNLDWFKIFDEKTIYLFSKFNCGFSFNYNINLMKSFICFVKLAIQLFNTKTYAWPSSKSADKGKKNKFDKC